MTRHKENIIKYGDHIKLQHVASSKYLGTNDNRYQFGSKQQCVFASDSPTTWVVGIPKGSDEENGYEVGYEDPILLKPVDFPDLRLHSNVGTLSPVTGQQEVSCLDSSDHHSDWKVMQADEDDDDDFWRIGKKFYLVHSKSHKYLHSHNIRFANDDNEVTAYDRDENSLFVVV